MFVSSRGWYEIEDARHQAEGGAKTVSLTGATLIDLLLHLNDLKTQRAAAWKAASEIATMESDDLSVVVCSSWDAWAKEDLGRRPCWNDLHLAEQSAVRRVAWAIVSAMVEAQGAAE